ncbi:MAG TPA: sigma-70 family RNA polymerase sigma factor [Acidimicrobiales bacterium]|nr:sigma-70 family RNA polymerase sigma factor [Acidimicrobiales bacterium]
MRQTTDPGALDDAALIDRCRNDDSSAWRELVARHQRYVWSIARSLGLDEAAAADATQATFAALVAQLDRIRQPERVRAWLGVVVRRETWRARERIRRDDRLDPDTEFADPSGDRELEIVDLVDALDQALDELSPACRELIRRLFLSDRPDDYHSVAADLGRPVGSIGPSRGRCLEKLRTVLARNDGDLVYQDVDAT